MKKLFYSLLTLAAALSLASCQPDKLLGGDALDGAPANLTLTVTLGPQTKTAFADGSQVNELYAGLYEITGTDTYAYVTHTATAGTITSGEGSVTFTGEIHRGKSYKVVFWAQKNGAPYTRAWDPAPTITASASGNANDEARDAFYGEYLTGTVNGNINETTAVELKRPFAQVNVLVPNDNIAAYTSLQSSMTVAQAPTVLNLATKDTSVPTTWSFTLADMAEPAFGNYVSSHKYVAMNYVLVDQTAADPRYDVAFRVKTNVDDTGENTLKTVANAPMKPNVRTNIIGNVFAEDFNLTVPVVINPTPGESVVTTVTVSVGQTAQQAQLLAYDPTLQTQVPTTINVVINHPINDASEAPTFTYNPDGVATAVWVIDNATQGTGHIEVTPLVENGITEITATFPAVTKAEYAPQTAKFYVKVGNGINATATSLTVNPTELAVKMGNTADFEVTASEGVGSITIAPMDNTYFTIALKEGSTYTVTPKAVTTDPVTVTISAPAASESYSAPADVTLEISVSAKDVVAQSVTFDPKSSAITFGDSFTVPAPTTENLAPNSALVYSLGEGTTADAFSITSAGVLTINHVGTAKIVATAAQVETTDKVYNSASDTYTLTVNKKQLDKPAAPTVQKSGDDGIEVSWVENENAASYTLSYAGASAATQTVTGLTATTYTIQNLADDTYVVTIKAVAAANGDYSDSEESDASEEVVIAAPVTNTIAEVAAMITSTDQSNPSDYTANLAGAVVSYVNGKNVYLEDNSGAIMLFIENSGLSAGQTITGPISGSGYVYNGLKEITAIGTAYTATDGGTIPETTVTLADLLANYDSYVSRRVKLVGVTVTNGIAASGDRDGEISQNASTIAVRSQLSSNGPVLTLNDIGNLIAYPAIYNTTKQLSFYETSQFTKTGEVPVLSATPATKTVNASETSVTWTITSNTDWTITPGTGVTASETSGNGNAEVTLSFAKNTTTTAATYTATVSADGCADVTITITQNGEGTVATTHYYTQVTSAPTDWSGSYLMVSSGKALSSISSTSTKYGIGSDVTISDGKIESTETVDAYVVVIEKATGSGSGYTMKLSNAYLNWTSGNSLNTVATESDNTRWTITSGTTSGNYIISNVADATRQIWWNTSSPRFACYAGKDESSTGYSAITLYKYE